MCVILVSKRLTYPFCPKLGGGGSFDEIPPYKNKKNFTVVLATARTTTAVGIDH